jgi:Ca2+-binding RTX toxin-like protein
MSTGADGTVTITGAKDVRQDWQIDQRDPATEPGTIDIIFYTDPVDYPVGGEPAPNCVDTDGDPANPPASSVTCTFVSRVVTISGNRTSLIDASTNYHCCYQTGSSLGLFTIPLAATGGGGVDEIEGGATNDVISGGNANDLLVGGMGDDVIDGDEGSDSIFGDFPGGGPQSSGGNDTLRGGNGDDDVHGGGGNDNVDSGPGNDHDVGGGPGNDTVTTGDGNDVNVNGGPGNDVIDTGAGNDEAYGGPGDDVINLGDGNDYGQPDDGNVFRGQGIVAGIDVTNGGNGDDYILEFVDGHADTSDGGPGTDTVEYSAARNSTTVNDAVNISLDDQPNDGFSNGSASSSPDDRSNNFVGYEAVFTYVDETPVTATGNGAANDIEMNCLAAFGSFPAQTCDSSADNVDPGPGSDVVYTRGGPDTINSVDGAADYIHCGRGQDNATVDQLDTTVECENVVVRNVAAAAEDLPPAVAWVSPTPNSTLPNTTRTRFEATAVDDHGIAKVVFQVGTREVCTDTTAPYSCDYLPTGADLGRNTLIATAYDTSNQTATALNTATVPRFRARGLTATTKPKTDTSIPITFVTTGQLLLPPNVTPAQGCATGLVAVQFRNGRNTVSNRRVHLRKDCTYRSAVTFANLSRLQATAKTLEVRTSFTGNEVIARISAKIQRVTVRR